MSKSVKESCLEIDFQDFFQEDTMTLKMNDCIVFENLVLTSSQSTGLTNVQVFAYEYSAGLISLKLVLWGDSDKEVCRLKKNEVYHAEIILNGQMVSFELFLGRGKYFGFSKKGEADLYFNQSQIPFEYD